MLLALLGLQIAILFFLFFCMLHVSNKFDILTIDIYDKIDRRFGRKRQPKTVALTPTNIAASVRSQEEPPVSTIGPLPDATMGDAYAADITQPDEYNEVDK
jgi:hypothetical protein